MNRWLIGVVVFFVLAILAVMWIAFPRRLPLPPPSPPNDPGLLTPSVHSETPVTHAPVVMPKWSPTPTPPPDPVAAVMPAVQTDGPILTEIVKLPPKPAKNAEAAAPQEREEQPQALYGRLIPCTLVNALVSSDRRSVPIIATVEKDLVWNGKIVIGRCTEVHGMGQMDYEKDSITAEGVWTLIVKNEQYPGWTGEMHVQGMALDYESDPNLKSYGILNASSGIHGMTIRTDAWADVKVFAATALATAAQSTASTTTTLFGTTAYNPNGKGAGGISGTVLNPLAAGSAAVLNEYAQTIVDAIKRDGVYVLVPPKKTFLLYVTQDIYAPRGGDGSRLAAQRRFLKEREVQEDVTEPRDRREARADAASQNPLGAFNTPPQAQSTNPALERAQEAHQERQRAFQEQVKALQAQPAPTP